MKVKQQLWKEFHTEYRTWANMLERCRNPNHPQFHYWGGRGVKVCERWQTFASFLADMGRRPSKAYSLERRNGDGDYEPTNCYWATKVQQNNNLRRNIKLTHNGETLSLAQWARKLDLPFERIRSRYRNGWATEDVLRVESGKYRNHRRHNSKSILVEFRGKTLDLSEWAEELGLDYQVLRSRHRYGWPPARILTEPVRKRTIKK